jgi:peptidyl-prolyl cis-trans isomerase A (cyclophilin A)
MKTLILFLTLASYNTPSFASKTVNAEKSKNPVAVIKTSMGTIRVKLFKDKAPKTVENFIGLATGKKDWKDPKTGKAMKNKPLYAGTIFHRVIPDFMIQGGDPLGRGIGGPGYQFEDEFDPLDSFTKPGILAMANAGPATNGSQFFITVAPTPHLAQRHTIFGEVESGLDVVIQISKVARDAMDKPLKDVKIESIQIK